MDDENNIDGCFVMKSVPNQANTACLRPGEICACFMKVQWGLRFKREGCAISHQNLS